MDYKNLLLKLHKVSKEKILILTKEKEELKEEIKQSKDQIIKLKEEKSDLIDQFEKEINNLKEEIVKIKVSKEKDISKSNQEAIDLRPFIEAQKELYNDEKRNKISFILEVFLVILVLTLLFIQVWVILQ